jgi:hypothetical protein
MLTIGGMTVIALAACSGGGGEQAKRAVVLSEEDLQLAVLTASDLPADVDPSSPWNELEIKDPKADVAECQPIVDLYSAEPRRPRHARVLGHVVDARGGDRYGDGIYLDSYSTVKEASVVLEDVRKALDVCTSKFSIVGGFKFNRLEKALDPDVGDESLAFGEEGSDKYNLVRIGSVLVVFTSGDQKTYSGPGKIDPTIVNAQVVKAERTIAQVAKR